MTMNTANLSELLWPGIKDMFGQTYNEYPPLYTQYMDVMETDMAFDKFQGLTELPLLGVKDQGAAISFQDIKQGFQREIMQVSYALGGVITREMMDFNQYRQMMDIPKALARSCRKTEETVAANLLNNGFSTAANPTRTADGLSLFNSAHLNVGSGTFRNTPATASDLTMTALEQAHTDISNFVDDWGNPILARAVSLVVSTSDQHTARKILETEYAVGSANNDKNVVSSAMIPLQLIVNPYLTDPDAWFIKTDVPNGLVWLDSAQAEIERDNDFHTKNLEFSIYRRFGTGAVDARGYYGSAGA